MVALTTEQVAARLGVKTQTVYAYVSRGLLHPQKGTGGKRSVFDAREVDALRDERRRIAPGELHTAVSTQLTSVSDAGLFLRGHNVIDVIRAGATFADITARLWDAPPGETASAAPELDAPSTNGLTPLNHLRVAVAAQASTDAFVHDLSPKAVRRAAGALLGRMARALPPRGAGSDSDIPNALWRRLAPQPANAAQHRALDVALALLADHGLATSTFAARVAASVRADIYSVVSAGLGALGGALHGAQSARVHAMYTDAQTRGANVAVAAAQERYGAFPGTGHSVYRRGDPRYDALLDALFVAFPHGEGRDVVDAVCTLVETRSEARPNIDLALGALTYLSTMEPAAGEAIFAIARTAGFVAHALEEYAEPPLRFRPRARYMGLPPQADVEED